MVQAGWAFELADCLQLRWRGGSEAAVEVDQRDAGTNLLSMVDAEGQPEGVGVLDRCRLDRPHRPEGGVADDSRCVETVAGTTTDAHQRGLMGGHSCIVPVTNEVGLSTG